MKKVEDFIRGQYVKVLYSGDYDEPSWRIAQIEKVEHEESWGDEFLVHAYWSDRTFTLKELPKSIEEFNKEYFSKECFPMEFTPTFIEHLEMFEETNEETDKQLEFLYILTDKLIFLDSMLGKAKSDRDHHSYETRANEVNSIIDNYKEHIKYV